MAGDVLMSYFEGTLHVQRKQVANQSEGLVTVADLDAERVIVDHLRRNRPDDRILAEESDAEEIGLGDRVWVIDPLDGTNNFTCGIPHFAVSIALWVAGEARVGVVFQPTTSDWFVAVRGEGAWWNGKPARVSPHTRLDEIILGVGFYYDRGAMMEATLLSIGELFRTDILGIRRMGAASLDLAYVGVGRFGGFFEYVLAPWDFAAGSLFVSEAGGMVTDCQGGVLDLKRSGIIASNSALHRPIQQIVSKNWST
jgi:myo-inositol-1(or 4)-monophosphatase